MDQQAANLQALLKRSAQTEQKIASLNQLKSDIKHYRVPENATATVFECVRLSIAQQASSTLASTAFSTLGHLIKRLKIQDASGHIITQLAPRLFPALQERLGDLREAVRSAASQSFCDLYPFCSAEIEQIIRDEAISSSNVRTKEAGMRWVIKMHKDEGIPFKGYVGSIVSRLEDADGNVREAAKAVIIDLFGSAPERAKLDLKRQLKAYSVRHSIVTQILSQIGGDTASTSRPQTADKSEGTPELTGSTRSQNNIDAQLAEAINSEAAQPPPQEVVPMDPLYVQTKAELEDIFHDMRPHFEGKETEHNWVPRDKSILKLRRILKGNAPNEFHTVFMAGIKSMVEGIIKVATSLRTTMASNGCQLVQELARTLGPALDKEVEILLQAFVKMSAATKHIAAENGRVTSNDIFQNCSYHVRMMQHIWLAVQEKNVQQRQCTPGWLQTILKRQASYKHNFETSGGLDLAEKCIKKGLDDANPKVKEGFRATYWTFARSWPDRAEGIISKLDPKSKTALERDPNNPNAALFASTTASTTLRTGGTQSRNTLRSMMAEQRKAKAAGTLSRPNSAMADLSAAKQKPPTASTSARGPSNLSKVTNRNVSATSTAPAPAPQPETSTSAKKGSSLMSGPVRRPRRPEVPRPQTADPYASRRVLRPVTPTNGTPAASPQRGTGASKASVASSAASRNGSRIPTTGSPVGSPVKRSPAVARNDIHDMSDSRPSSKGDITMTGEGSFREDDLPMVVPKGSITTARGTFSPGHKRSGLGQTRSVDSGRLGLLEDEDNFTMVVPNHADNRRNQSPLAYQSPMKAMFDDARARVGKLSPEAEKHMTKPERSAEDVTEPNDTARPIMPEADNVQVYEDPFTEHDSRPDSREERKVLGELPVNENMRLSSPAQSATSSTSPAGSPQQISTVPLPSISTPQDRSEAMRNKKLLVSGIERIRSKTLDAHGFHKIQDVVKSKTDIWDGGKKYDELMSVVLEYLQTFESDPKLMQQPQKAVGLKAQALGLVRALLTIYRKQAATWHARCLVTVLACRKNVENGSHIVADMQRTSDEIVSEATSDACIDAIIEFLSETDDSAGKARSIAMSLVVLRQILTTAKSKGVELGADRRSRLARTTADYLNDEDSEVRKVDVDLASELFESFPEPKTDFWTEFKGVDEGRLGLLTYYIARREKTAAH